MTFKCMGFGARILAMWDNSYRERGREVEREREREREGGGGRYYTLLTLAILL